MKYTLTIIISVLNYFDIQAQQFEFLYDHNGFSNDGVSIVKMNSGYFTTHAARNLNFDYTTLVAAFDENASLIWDTSLTSLTIEKGQSNWNVNILSDVNNSDKWVIGNFVDSGNNSRTVFLNKFNEAGQIINEVILDTLFEKSPDVWGGFSNISGLYLLCRDNTLGGNNRMLIVKCTIEGQYDWHQSYNVGFSFSPKCIVDVEDGFIVGGSRYANLIDQGNGDGEQIILKFNYNGISQWTNTVRFNGNANFGAVGIIKLNSGNFLFAGTKNIDNVSIQPLIGELDAGTGDTLWTKLFFESQVYDANDLANFNSINRIHGFKQLSDGGYLGVGECRHDIIPDSAFGPLDNAAFLMKLDNNFNLLWKRIYIPEGYDELDASPAQCQLNDFVENEDGSITALGRVYMCTGTGPQGGYIQDSYMIRVDSLGCLIPGCSIGITEFDDLSDLLVYPNPTSSNLTIQLPTNDSWTVRLYNMNGQVVSAEKINGNNRLDLNLQNFTSGLYTVQAMNENGKVYTKVVVRE